MISRNEHIQQELRIISVWCLSHKNMASYDDVCLFCVFLMAFLCVLCLSGVFSVCFSVHFQCGVFMLFFHFFCPDSCVFRVLYCFLVYFDLWYEFVWHHEREYIWRQDERRLFFCVFLMAFLFVICLSGVFSVCFLCVFNVFFCVVFLPGFLVYFVFFTVFWCILDSFTFFISSSRIWCYRRGCQPNRYTVFLYI